jgi:hypothetical protein
MLQPVALKNTISFAATTTFPLDPDRMYVFPESLMVKTLTPRYQRPASSCGTGSPLGQGAAAADALGTGELRAAGLLVGADVVDDDGVPPPHPAAMAAASTIAPFFMAALSGG